MAKKYQYKKKPPCWREKLPPYQIGIDGFTWGDLKKDYNGWTDPKLYLPLNYDLVLLDIERKKVHGWWNGIEWEGLRLLADDKVLFWKYEE